MIGIRKNTVSQFSTLSEEGVYNPSAADVTATEADFTLSSQQTVVQVTRNGQMLLESEWTQLGLNLNVDPEFGFTDVNDVIQVFHQNQAALNAELNYLEITSAYSVVDSNDIVEATSGTFDVTLPTVVGFPKKKIHIKNSGAGTVTVITTGAETIDGSPTAPISSPVSLTFFPKDANWILL